MSVSWVVVKVVRGIKWKENEKIERLLFRLEVSTGEA